jgi:DNA-binding IclR family transcriptional regulator
MRVITRTLGIMSELGQVPTGLSLQQLADRLDVPVPSMHRLLSVLCDAGFVVRVPSTRLYFVGPNALSLGAAAARGRRLHQTPPAPLARAAASTGDTFFLTEAVGNRSALCVAVAPGKRFSKSPIELGQVLPLGTMSCTRILLLDLPDDHLSRLISRTLQDLPAGQRRGPLSHEAAMTRLHTSRRVGFDVGKRELSSDTWVLSVPVRDLTANVRQGLNVVTPARRAARQQVRTSLMTTVLVVAQELSRADATRGLIHPGDGLGPSPAEPRRAADGG